MSRRFDCAFILLNNGGHLLLRSKKLKDLRFFLFFQIIRLLETYAVSEKAQIAMGNECHARKNFSVINILFQFHLNVRITNKYKCSKRRYLIKIVC
jgi:hypothetical protein